jgi:hypothetical protein
MLASAILVLGVLVERMTTALLEGGRALRVFGHPADSGSLTLQELLMLALVALAADGVTQWLTGQRISPLLIGIMLIAVCAFPLLALLGAPPSMGLVIENVVVIPTSVVAMLLSLLCLSIRAQRIQRFSQRSAMQRASSRYVGAI